MQTIEQPQIEIGAKYYRFTVIDFAPRTKTGHAAWVCKCECGNIRQYRKSELLSGRCRSCGCTRYTDRTDTLTTHGGTGTAEYSAWLAMRQRCFYPKSAHFARYGGRGITVCARWKDSFENFLADMGKKPSPQHSLDRVDNAGNYEPQNCRWATKKEQSCNTSANVFLTHNGETLTISQWTEKLGFNQNVIAYRLKHGWSVEKALDTPVKTNTTQTNTIFKSEGK
jgi:hypothetical protein